MLGKYELKREKELKREFFNVRTRQNFKLKG